MFSRWMGRVSDSAGDDTLAGVVTNSCQKSHALKRRAEAATQPPPKRACTSGAGASNAPAPDASPTEAPAASASTSQRACDGADGDPLREPFDERELLAFFDDEPLPAAGPPSPAPSWPPPHAHDEAEGVTPPAPRGSRADEQLSQYELQRKANIEGNHRVLTALGLGDKPSLVPTEPPAQARATRRPIRPQPTRKQPMRSCAQPPPHAHDEAEGVTPPAPRGSRADEQLSQYEHELMTLDRVAIQPVSMPAPAAEELHDALVRGAADATNSPHSIVLALGGPVPLGFNGWDSFGDVNAARHNPREQSKKTSILYRGEPGMLERLRRGLPGFEAVTELVADVAPGFKIAFVHVLLQSSAQATFAWHRDNETEGYERVRKTLVVLLSDTPSSMQVRCQAPFQYGRRGSGALFGADEVHRSGAASPGTVKVAVMLERSLQRLW